MQEEVEAKTVTLVINCSKLTEQELKKALAKLITAMKNRDISRHGKMTVKELAAQNQGMQSIEVTDANIGSFNRIAAKYGIDFAPFKVKGENRHLVFFKARDTDAMTAAFKEYTSKTVERSKKPSVLKRLEHFKSLIKKPVVDKAKHKAPER